MMHIANEMAMLAAHVSSLRDKVAAASKAPGQPNPCPLHTISA